jgi:hypothetical protein
VVALAMSTPTPYLSVVVTTRNDDHGGGLLRRTQTFVNAFLGQVKRHRVPAELIFVEWNPPANRPPLREALSWPDDREDCRVRFVEVPQTVHARYQNAAVLPLYQMIGKNVGIRRAVGEFVLATNIDILFSDELMSFLASRSLVPGRMYRIDRHDVMPDVPVGGPVDQQLAYCKTHLLRVNAREGTFPVDAAGLWSGARQSNPREVGAASKPRSQTPPAGLFSKVAGVARRAAEGGPWIPVAVPVPSPLRACLRLFLRTSTSTTEQQPTGPGAPEAGISTPKAETAAPEEPPLPPEVHTNACGDFTLMSRADWFDLRAYPEWDLYSFHMDSVLCLAAHFGGVREVMLNDPMRIYHIEHGSGWTPEGQRQLFSRLRDKGVGWLDFEDLVQMARQMQQLKSPMIFNRKDWGLVDFDLPETSLG